MLLLGGTAQAAGKVEAKDAYQRATKYYNLSDFQHALESFKEAYLDYPDPSFLYNIAQCQRLLGQKQDAVLSYKAYLRERPSSPLRAEVTTQIDTLDQQVQADDEAERVRLAHEAETAKPADNATTTPALTQVVAMPPSRQPVYKKWWLWTIVGGGVVAIALGVGLGLGLRATAYPSATLSDGKVHF